MLKEYERLRRLGLSPMLAEYYAVGRKRAVKIEPQEDFTLFVLFDNGEMRMYPLAEKIKSGGEFEAIKDLDKFKSVKIDEDNNILWSVGVKINADTIYLKSMPID